MTNERDRIMKEANARILKWNYSKKPVSKENQRIDFPGEKSSNEKFSIFMFSLQDLFALSKYGSFLGQPKLSPRIS